MAMRFPKISENLFEITIYNVQMRLCNLIGEYIVGKYFQTQKASSLSKFLLLPSCKQNFLSVKTLFTW